MQEAEQDPSVQRLAELFRSHPAWTRAAALLSDEACSNVRFRHRPGETWHLARVRGVTQLGRGPRRDADFEFGFPPAAIERLAQARGGIGAFAIALFELIVSSDEALRVDLRILAPFSTLIRRGYLRLLLAGGPRVIAWGSRHGVSTLGQLRRLVARVRGAPGVSAEAEMAQHAQASGEPETPGRGARRSRAWRSAAPRKPPNA